MNAANSLKLSARLKNSGAGLRPAMSGRLARENTGARRQPGRRDACPTAFSRHVLKGWFSSSRCSTPVLILLLVGDLRVGQAETATPTNDYSGVEAIFTQHCLECHGSTEPEGKLILESHELLMKGGGSGAVIVPGKSEESLLMRMIEGRVEKDGKKLIMPPPKKRDTLKAEEIALIRAWIDAGARPPAEFKPKELAVPKIEPKVPPRNSINTLAYSAGRKWIAAGRYSEVELRSAETHAIVQTLKGHRGNVNAVAFSPDGKFLFAAGGEAGWLGEVRQWDLADAELFYLFEGHRDAIYSLAVSPDGRTLATGSYDQKIKLWNIQTGEEIKTLSGHNGAVFGLTFRADGKILASASADRTVKLWDVASGERRDTLSQPLKEQYTVAFSPDGKRLYAGGVDNRIRVWQISDNAAETTNPLLESRFAHEGAILNLAFSSDGRSLASSAADRTVRLWDTAGAELKEKLPLERQPDWAPALAIALENKAVVVGRLDGTIEFYDAATGKSMPAAKPELARAEPRGVQRGKETRVKLVGKNLLEVTGVKSASAGLKIELTDSAPSSRESERPFESISTSEHHSSPEGAPRRTDSGIWIKITAPDTLPRGSYELWATGPGGESGKIKVHVDDLPQVPVPQKDKTLRLASLPADVWATHETSGDSERIEFDANTGQTLVFDAAARELGSKSDLVLTLSDSSGTVLDSSNGFDGNPDPFLAYTFAAGGRFNLRVSELLLGASPDHFYRLSIGDLPWVTGCFPLSVPANTETKVELIGYNLPPEHRVEVKPEGAGEMLLPVNAERYRTRRELKLIVGAGTELIETEPNDSPAQAMKISPPCAVAGRIRGLSVPTPDSVQVENSPGTPETRLPSSPPLSGGAVCAEGDVDLFRFDAKAGRQWIIETQAAQRGSPVDTKIEVLRADGRPLERLQLQAVRDTIVNFRGVDSNNPGMRLENWEEMELNQLVYLKGDVVKIFRMPQGPDSDMLFYAANGKRRAWFDTTATAHALEEPGYIVEPHPPGAKLVSNGLPVFHLYYENDDDGERKLGTDSKLFFTAPEDSAYLIRVSDTRGYSAERFAYRLVVREPKPDFKVTLNGAHPAVSAGSGREFSLSAERLDGFDGDIQIEISGLPPGFSVSTPLVIQAGHTEAKGTINAAPDAVQPVATNATTITATATIEGKPVAREVNNFGALSLGEKPKLLVFFEPDSPDQSARGASGDLARPLEISIAPGQTVPARLRILRNGHDDLVTFTVENLPHGVIVDNIGLNGVLIPKGEYERQVFLTAAKWVPEQDRLCYAVENQAGKQTSLPVLLKVRHEAPKMTVAGQ